MYKSIKIKQIFITMFGAVFIAGYFFGSTVSAQSLGSSKYNSAGLFAATDSSAFSGSKDAVCNGVGLGGNACSSSSNGSSSINNIISNVLDILSWIVGIAAVLMIIISGFRIIVSGGDSNSFNSAKNGILYAIIGLVIVAAAQIIVQYVLKSATG